MARGRVSSSMRRLSRSQDNLHPPRPPTVPKPAMSLRPRYSHLLSPHLVLSYPQLDPYHKDHMILILFPLHHSYIIMKGQVLNHIHLSYLSHQPTSPLFRTRAGSARLQPPPLGFFPAQMDRKLLCLHQATVFSPVLRPPRNHFPVSVVLPVV